MGRIARNMIVYFKAFPTAGRCNRRDRCAVRFQGFVAFVRLQVRVGICALRVGINRKDRQ